MLTPAPIDNDVVPYTKRPVFRRNAGLFVGGTPAEVAARPAWCRKLRSVLDKKTARHVVLFQTCSASTGSVCFDEYNKLSVCGGL